jgi:hypothetical protein
MNTSLRYKDMSDEKLAIGDALLNPIIQSIDETLSSLDKQVDMRKSLRSLAEVSSKVRVFPDFEDSAENRFASFLVWAMLAQAEAVIKNQDDESFKSNIEDYEKYKAALKDYLINIKQGLKDKSYQRVIEATKIYFNDVNKISLPGN